MGYFLSNGIANIAQSGAYSVGNNNSGGEKMSGAAIGAIIQGGADMGQNMMNAAMLQKNINSQQFANKYGMVMSLINAAREDNSVQRRVADLKAAGLSPTLAAGSSASTSIPLKINPVDYSWKGGNWGDQVAQLQNTINQSMVTEKQVGLLEESRLRVKQQRELELANNPTKVAKLASDTVKNQSQANLNSLESYQKEVENRNTAGTGLPTKTSLIGGNMRDLASWLNNLSNAGKAELKAQIKQVQDDGGSLWDALTKTRVKIPLPGGKK